MNREYKYKLGRRVWITSSLYIAIFMAAAVVVGFIFQGGYITAWLSTLLLAIFALMILSIPRKVVVAEDGIEIHCISDYTFFAYADIAHIRRVSNKEMKHCIPIFGAMGFFGHYGRFLNLDNMEFIHIYASRWNKFVEITDIDGERYYISCEEYEDLITRVESTIEPHDISENL